MSGARADVLSNIRRALGATGTEKPRRESVAEHLEQAPKGIIPERGQLDAQARKALFKAQAERVQASVVFVASSRDVPGEVARFLRDGNLPAEVRMGEDERLAAMPWDQTALDVTRGPSDGSDLIGVSHAFGAVAETGTLVMVSGKDNPTTINFLPDHHIVVVAAADLGGDYERVLQKLRTRYGKGRMPRTVNLITGPSRSADIAHTMLLGAHGPRNLHIIVTEI